MSRIILLNAINIFYKLREQNFWDCMNIFLMQNAFEILSKLLSWYVYLHLFEIYKRTLIGCILPIWGGAPVFLLFSFLFVLFFLFQLWKMFMIFQNKLANLRRYSGFQKIFTNKIKYTFREMFIILKILLYFNKCSKFK